ncbi:MAG: Gfo/Idh/MocA family protein [Butyricicoccaceae bacterium]
MDKMKVGVVGLGDISHVYLTTLNQFHQYVTLEACAARSLEKAQRKAEQYGIRKAYATPEELIADPEVDLILNLTPPDSHAKFNRMALEAGKHVYSEKPLAATFAEAEEIMKLAQEKGLAVGCAPDTFLGARFQTVRELIDHGTIGEITGATAFCTYHGVETFHPSPFFYYQPGAGPLMDIGPYYFTALFALLGPVRRCCAMSKRTLNTRTPLHPMHVGKTIEVNVDTHTTGLLEFENGALATVLFSFDIWDSELPRIELYGTKGTICIRDVDPLSGPNLFGGELWLKTEKEYRWYSNPRTQEEMDRDWIRVPLKRPFASTSHQDNSRGIGLVDLVLGLQEGREARASGRMALHSLEVMEGMFESAKTGQFYLPHTTFTVPDLLPEQFGAE